MREQHLKSGESIKHAAEIQPRKRDRGFEGKSEGEREDVSGGMLQGPEDRGWKPVVRVNKGKEMRFFDGVPEGIEMGVVEAGAQTGGAKDKTF